MRLPLRLLYVLALSILAAGCGGSKGYELKLPEIGTSVVMPAAPQLQEPDPSAPDLTIYSLDDGDTRFMLCFIPVRMKFDTLDVQVLLDGMAKRRIAATSSLDGFRLTGQRPVHAGDLPGREWDCSFSHGGVHRERLFVVKPHGAVVITATCKNGPELSPAAIEYLDSFKVTTD